MKYSLRSLMIVVTLICVGLGGLMARVEYLRQCAIYHERESKRFDDQVNRKIEQAGTPTKISELFPGFEEARARIYHDKMAMAFRQAMYRPWTVVGTPEGVEPP